jgi:hypothetical protein
VSRIAALGVVASALVLAQVQTAAAADSCLDKVRDLAGRYGTPSNPPTAKPNGKAEVTTQDLARSGGVIKPPPVQDKSVITPAPNTRDAMQTVPDVAPQALKEDPAADRTKIQAALTAARAQSEHGDEKGCLEALDRARTLADRADTK